MGVFESLNDTSNKAVDISEQFYRKTQEYYKLKVFHQLASTTGMFCKMAILGSLAFLGILFLTVGATIYLGEVLGSMIYSCLIMGLFFFVIVMVLFTFRNRIDNLIVRKLSRKFFN
ncbi:hypothetical protein [Maribacter cobaltidurans]|uniref:Uncharacterized protein n=1 Tax=Maribacter cobaltidurans TaxID=1178778 RepID=A0A223V7G1_9FLAO|nr:hypothetical protein [Maribacter cobaltidurans]ASV30779.1 hypothetical protein CJ263_11445 [Maribacter cobaltidurans]GGD81676.1 hypothetical protein GCM10011412_19330 [Maribacter cobaltidurans]